MSVVNTDTGGAVSELIGAVFAEAEAATITDAELFAGIDDPRTIRRLREALADGSLSRTTLHQAARMRAHAKTKPVRRKPSQVYFIVGEATGLIKIGVAVDPNARVRSLQTGSPDRLSLLAAVVGDEQMERDLHRQFASARVHGEWFSPSADLLAFIESLGAFK